MKFSSHETEKVGRLLNDNSKPLKQRFRALFTLKNIGGDVALSWMRTSFSDESELLKHEVAYCLGQMGDASAVPILIDLLCDKRREVIVRHEAAEALGALGGDTTVQHLLQEYSNDPVIEVAETCQLAMGRLRLLASGDAFTSNAFNSVDPAPPSECVDVHLLTQSLLDESLCLFDRYRCMFSLRNISSPESIDALCKGLSEVKNVLMRHELAFVLGQLQSERSTLALVQRLCDPYENAMVRHESAEALGAIANEEAFTSLQKFANDYTQPAVVRESCIVALDFAEYNVDDAQFQYADGLVV